MDMNFGKLRNYYDSARQKYPSNVMNYVFSIIGKSSCILDVGCGTGISTRQFINRVENISGCDIDKKMIEIAKSYNKNINFYVAPTDNMPFGDKEFEILTSFGAFHWFCDDESISEIKRVLKNNGFFIIINKNDVGEFGRIYLDIIKEVSGIEFPKSVKTNYNPNNILLQSGFSNVLTKKYSHIEEFSIKGALEQIQSMNSWNFVPDIKKQDVLKVLNDYFNKSAINGIIYRQLEIIIVSGNK